jgi:hypothetical protein
VYQFSGSDGFPPLRTPFYNKTMVQFTTKLGTRGTAWRRMSPRGRPRADGRTRVYVASRKVHG